MPLAVEITINGHSISELYITRVEGGTLPDDENTYEVFYNDIRSMTKRERARKDTFFTHRYGDGAEVCTMKAIAALKEAGEL